jgi:hypothetical protein
MRIRVIDGVPHVGTGKGISVGDEMLAEYHRPLDDRPDDAAAREAWLEYSEPAHRQGMPLRELDGLYETMREFVGCPDGTHRLVLRRVEP